ncbi:unnamed protein product [marine sediment metagenome]|uniref:Uncharacterized protein n=1 Tax=marine sediment metagenome TaxID=412755 RepID=X1JDH7_9ZZZZ
MKMKKLKRHYIDIPTIWPTPGGVVFLVPPTSYCKPPTSYCKLPMYNCKKCRTLWEVIKKV